MLTTVQQVKAFLIGIGEEVPPAHEARIEFEIQRQGADVETFCRRKFGTASYAEVHTGQTGQLYLYPHQWPVTGITSVTIDGVAVTEGTGSANYRQSKSVDGEVVALYREDGWASEPYGVSLAYTAGYILPATPMPSNRSLPYDLEGAVVELAAGGYLHRGRAGVTRESFEGLSLDVDRWPLHILKTLRKYQRPML